MRTFASIAVLLAAVAGILSLSVASARREQQSVLQEFTSATRQQVHASVEALSARLDALDQDTRMLVDLVERSRAQRDFAADTERRVWTSAFRALAVVVAQYRTIALVAADGTFEVLAVDPTETAATVEALMPPTRHLAAAVSANRTKVLGTPVRQGARSFLLYGTPVKGGGAIIVASDAAIFLGAVAWTPLPVARLFVTDPAGVVWADCETSGGCRASPPDAALALPPRLVPPPARTASRSGRTAAADPTPPVEISERVERPTGTWKVTWLASSAPLVERERSLLWRIVATTLAAVLAVAGVGLVMLRQQRTAVTLASRLQMTQAVADARQTSQSIVENAPLGVLGVSPDQRVVLANQFLIDRLGPIRLGAPLREAFSGSGVAWLAAVEPLLVAARAPAGADDAHLEMHAVNTGAHQLSVRVVPVSNQALGVRVFALVEDQSELRSLESQLVRAEKLITVGVLSAGIAHEIGSPLAVIRGRAEQVLRQVPATEPRAEDLRIIIKHIDNITSTIRQLLDFSRRQPVAPTAVPLDLVVGRARGLLQWKLEAKSLHLKVTLDDDLPMLAADADQLQQVLVNLLLNACDASEPGAELHLRAQAPRRREVCIQVIDHGCGISAEHMNAVFDPFFTTKKRGEGTGLGLTIAAGIVRNHGGEINLVSAPGDGTTVTVLWPSVRAAARAQVRADV